MSTGIIVQYVGFQTTLLAREYTFTVREAGQDREFTLNIANEAFLAHHVKYQDAPAICSARLLTELASHANNPPESNYVITSAELEHFRDSHTEKRSNYPARQS